MSVAVPRPLNNSMNANLASRTSTTSNPSSSMTANRTSSANVNGKMAIPARPPMNSRASSTSATSSVAPLASSSSKDTSSSAGKVFAKPSKEWVLPERAKPGRKVCAEEPDNKRQSQNRLSQRAHRARRTDYIQTLEERLRQYEADEIHSNVRLQEVARALKTDNERMKNELMLMGGKMNELVAEREGWETERKGMEEMCASLMSEVERLRTQLGDSAGGGLKLESARPAVISHQRTTHPQPRYANPVGLPKERKTGPTVACPICPDPDPDCPCQQPAKQLAAVSPPALGIETASSGRHPVDDISAPHKSDCGLCKTPAECLCRVVNEKVSPPKPTIPGSNGKCDVCSSLTVCLCEDDSPPPLSTTFSNKNTPNLPRAAAALPLPLRSKNKTSGIDTAASVRRPLWRLDNVVKPGEPVCTGDPANCDACKNDSFGREFCGHLFEQQGSSGHVKPCNSCPGNCMSIQSLLSPDPGSSLANPLTAPVTVVPPSPTPVPDAERDHETMRCDEAWKKLKAHPNAKFASLALLADVVAGRTKCTGPTIELSPRVAHTPSPIPPPSTPLRASSIGVGSAPTTQPLPRSPLSAKPVSATAATTGTKRRVAVETSAVRDALRILDSTPSRAASEVVQVKAEPLDLDEVNERAAKKLRVE